jgi:hypothetical protein
MLRAVSKQQWLLTVIDYVMKEQKTISANMEKSLQSQTKNALVDTDEAYMTFFQKIGRELLLPLIKENSDWYQYDCTIDELMLCLNKLIPLLSGTTTQCELFSQRYHLPDHHPVTDSLKAYYKLLANVAMHLNKILQENVELIGKLSTVLLVSMMQFNYLCMMLTRGAYNAYQANINLANAIKKHRATKSEGDYWHQIAKIIQRSLLVLESHTADLFKLGQLARNMVQTFMPLIINGTLTYENYETHLAPIITQFSLKLDQDHYLKIFFKFQILVYLQSYYWHQRNFSVCLTLINKKIFEDEFNEVCLSAIFYAIDPHSYQRYCLMKVYSEWVRQEESAENIHSKAMQYFRAVEEIPRECSAILPRSANQPNHIDVAPTVLDVIKELKDIDYYYSQSGRWSQLSKPESALRYLLEQKKWKLAKKCEEDSPEESSMPIHFGDLVPFLGLYQRTAHRLYCKVKTEMANSVKAADMAMYSQSLKEMTSTIVPLLKARERRRVDMCRTPGSATETKRAQAVDGPNSSIDLLLPKLEFEPAFVKAATVGVAVTLDTQETRVLINAFQAADYQQFDSKIEQIEAAFKLLCELKPQTEALAPFIAELYDMLDVSWFTQYRGDIHAELRRRVSESPTMIEATLRGRIRLMKLIYLIYQMARDANHMGMLEDLRQRCMPTKQMVALFFDFIQQNKCPDLLVRQAQLVELGHLQLYLAAMQLLQAESLRKTVIALSQDGVKRLLAHANQDDEKNLLWKSQLCADKMRRQLQLMVNYPFIMQGLYHKNIIDFQDELSQRAWHDEANLAIFNRRSFQALRDMTDEQYKAIGVYCEFAFNVVRLYQYYSALNFESFHREANLQYIFMLQFNLKEHNELGLFLSPDIYFHYSIMSVMFSSDRREQSRIISSLRAVFKEFLFPELAAIYPLQQQLKTQINSQLVELLISLIELTNQLGECLQKKDYEQGITIGRVSGIWERIKEGVQLAQTFESRALKWQDILPGIKCVIDKFALLSAGLCFDYSTVTNHQSKSQRRRHSPPKKLPNREPAAIKQWQLIYQMISPFLPKLIGDDFCAAIEKIIGVKLVVEAKEQPAQQETEPYLKLKPPSSLPVPDVQAGLKPPEQSPAPVAGSTIAPPPVVALELTVAPESTVVPPLSVVSNEESSLEKENARLRVEKDDFHMDAILLTEQNKAIHSEKADLEQQVAALIAQNQQLQSQNSVLASEKKQSEKSLEKSAERLAKKSREHQLMAAQLTQLRSQLTDQTQQHAEHVATQKEQADKRIAELNKKVSDLESQAKTDKQKIEVQFNLLTAQKLQADQALDMANKTIATLQAQQSALAEKIDTLTKKNDDVSTSYAASESRGRDLETEKQALQQQLGVIAVALEQLRERHHRLAMDKAEADEAVTCHVDALSRHGVMFIRQGSDHVLVPSQPFFDVRQSHSEPGYGPIFLAPPRQQGAAPVLLYPRRVPVEAVEDSASAPLVPLSHRPS